MPGWKISRGILLSNMPPALISAGREIYYASPTHLVTVPVKTDPAFEIGTAKPLFEFTTSGSRAYDVSADGNRFLANVPVGEKPPPSITLVLNWAASLKR